jgi:hypothetical protein
MAHLTSERFSDGVLSGFDKQEEANLAGAIRKLNAVRKREADQIVEALAQAGELIGALKLELDEVKKAQRRTAAALTPRRPETASERDFKNAKARLAASPTQRRR